MKAFRQDVQDLTDALAKNTDGYAHLEQARAKAQKLKNELKIDELIQ